VKPQTYIRLSLLLPYVLWAILFLLALLQEGSGEGRTNFLGLEFITSIYLAGIFFWFIPYTLLALGLLIWSRHRPEKTILRVFAFSPLMLAVLILLEINLLSIITGGLDTYLSGQGFQNFVALNGLAVVFSLLAGYLCVGFGFALYKTLQSLKIIKEAQLAATPNTTEAF
jgi:hypothetical protein